MATPPDVVSQIVLAVPLYALFELGILLSYLAGRKSS
jgi:Sec-independent protein secretion pathway component TatC